MGVTAYVAAALDGELARIQGAVPGCRAATTYRAAAAIGNLVAAGHVRADEVEERLVCAALSAGLPTSQARVNVRRGLARGATTPRSVPDAFSASAQPHFVAPKATVLAPTLRHPPAAEIEAVWNRCRPVVDDEAVRDFLKSRCIDSKAVEEWDLARALPRDAHCPRWASHKGFSWPLTGHRLVLRCFDSAGRFASLRARRLQASDASPKNLVPGGYTTSGLVLADPVGQRLLAGELPAWWTPREVVVSEGETDFLTWATRQYGGSEQGPAYLGIWSGSWTASIASRIPDGTRVAVRTDPDAAGDAYAAAINRSLTPRCSCYRPRREPTP